MPFVFPTAQIAERLKSDGRPAAAWFPFIIPYRVSLLLRRSFPTLPAGEPHNGRFAARLHRPFNLLLRCEFLVEQVSLGLFKDFVVDLLFCS